MAATKMTEKEYREFKQKTGHREPQKVTTYYEENKRHEEGVKHHRERAAQNRDVVSLPGRVEKKLTGSTRITTATRQSGTEIREKAGRVKERVVAPFRPVARAAAPFFEDFGTMFGTPMQTRVHYEKVKGGKKGERVRVEERVRAPQPRVIQDYGFRFGLPNVMPHAMQMGAFGPVMPRESVHERRKKKKGVRKEPDSFHWEEIGGVPDDVRRWM